jgi:hypothetical protein
VFTKKRKRMIESPQIDLRAVHGGLAHDAIGEAAKGSTSNVGGRVLLSLALTVCIEEEGEDSVKSADKFESSLSLFSRRQWYAEYALAADIRCIRERASFQSHISAIGEKRGREEERKGREERRREVRRVTCGGET